MVFTLKNKSEFFSWLSGFTPSSTKTQHSKFEFDLDGRKLCNELLYVDNESISYIFTLLNPVLHFPILGKVPSKKHLSCQGKERTKYS